MKKYCLLICSIIYLGIGTSNAQFRILFNFDGTSGKYPAGSLTLSGHTLFGMTQWGGMYGSGNIFSIDTSGHNFKNLWQFGQFPFGDVTLSGHKLYGLTYQGGNHSIGNVFSIDTNGSGFKNLFNFNDTNGKEPTGSFILSNGTLYATTEQGGPSTVGVVFSIDTSGSRFKDLFEFNGVDGAYPQGSLMLSGHKFYGMTDRGGSHDSGCIFSMDTDGSNYHNLLNFNGANGRGAPTASPSGSLILSGNRLYGMTYAGGTSKYGCIFSIDTDGSGYKKLLNFNDTNGYGPFGSLILSGGNLYGVTSLGGLYTYGVIFSIDTSGNSYTILHNFDNTDGYFASGSLILAEHTLYGMAYAGGKYGGGIIFSYNLCPSLTITTDSTPDNGNCNGVATVNVTNGGNPPYTYLWTAGGQTTDTITGQCSGTYCCTITCNNGCSQTECVTIKSTAGIGYIVSGTGQITVYPNPSTGIFDFVITFSHAILPQAESASQTTIEIYNVLGKQVLTETLRYPQPARMNGSGGGDNSIDLSNQSNGVYLYRVVGENEELMGEGKLVIER